MPTPRTSHDPLCSGASRFPDHEVLREANCECDLIAQVRADERASLAREIELDRLALDDVDLDTYSARDIRIGLSRAARIARGNA